MNEAIWGVPAQPIPLPNASHEQTQPKQAKKPPSQLKEPLEIINHTSETGDVLDGD